MNEFKPEARKSSLGTKIIWALLVIMIIAICAAIAYPVHTGGGGANSKEGACKDNLRTIDGAIMQYAATHDGVYCADPDYYVPNYLKAWPKCLMADMDELIDDTTWPPHAECPYTKDPHTY